MQSYDDNRSPLKNGIVNETGQQDDSVSLCNHPNERYIEPSMMPARIFISRECVSTRSKNPSMGTTNRVETRDVTYLVVSEGIVVGDRQPDYQSYSFVSTCGGQILSQPSNVSTMEGTEEG
jgi:hypothetical protein